MAIDFETALAASAQDWMSSREKQAPASMAVGLVQGRSGTPAARNSAAILRAYSNMPWLRAVVGKVGRTIASTVWTLSTVRRGGAGKAKRVRELQRGDRRTRMMLRRKLAKQGDLELIDEHPLLDLLTSGNDMLTGLSTFQTLQNHMDLVGEGFLTKVRGALNQPTSLWPLPPHWVVETPFIEKRETATFEVRWRGWHAKLPATDVIWLKDPDPLNPYGRGTGTASALADELEADENAAQHISAFFRNSARPDLIVGLKSGDATAAKALEAKWIEKFGGAVGRRRPLIVPTDTIDVHEIGQTFSEIQMVPLRQYERDTIISVYGFPPEVFGILSSSNRATIEAAEFLYTKHVVDPRQEFLRSILQEQLVGDFDERLVLDYESMVTEDRDHKRQVFAQAPWAFEVDEHRALAEHDELPDETGKVHPLSTSIYFGQLEDASLDAFMPEPAPTEPEDGEDDASGTTPPPEPSDDAGDGSTPDLEQNNEPAPKALRPAIRQHAKQLTPDNLEILLAYLKDGRVRRSVWGPVGDHMRQIVEQFGVQALREIGQEIEFQATGRVAEYQRNFATNRSRLIDETTQGKLREILGEAMETGVSSTEIVNSIRSVYQEASTQRAFTISRTETTRAANFGVQESYVQAGIERKGWLATRGDDRVRDAHEILDGQIVEVADLFVVTEGEHAGATAEHPGDFGVAELDINCRCSTYAVFTDDEGRSVDMLNTETKRAGAWKAFEARRGPAEISTRRVLRLAFRRQERYLLEYLGEL